MMSACFALSLWGGGFGVERGIDLCRGTVELWWDRFGSMFAGHQPAVVSAMRGVRHWRSRLNEVTRGRYPQ